MKNKHTNYQPVADEMADEIAEAVDSMREIILPCNECDTVMEMEQVMRNSEYRQALVRLYSTLLDIDMRHNPERYMDEDWA